MNHACVLYSVNFRNGATLHRVILAAPDTSAAREIATRSLDTKSECAEWKFSDVEALKTPILLIENGYQMLAAERTEANAAHL